MRFNGIECSLCGKVDKLAASQDVPEGWFSFHHLGKLIELCSTACLTKWSKARAKVEKDLITLTPEEFCEIHCEYVEGEEQRLHCDVCPNAKSWSR